MADQAAIDALAEKTADAVAKTAKMFAELIANDAALNKVKDRYLRSRGYDIVKVGDRDG